MSNVTQIHHLIRKGSVCACVCSRVSTVCVCIRENCKDMGDGFVWNKKEKSGINEIGQGLEAAGWRRVK